MEKKILVKGLNYSIPPSKLNYGDYCINFEILFKDIIRHGHLNAYDLDVTKTKLKDLALSSFKDYNLLKNQFSNLTEEESKCLKSLSENKNLVIQKSDKGNAVVLLDKSDYTDRVEELLSDPTKFQVAPIKDGKILRHLINVRKSFKTVLDKLLKEQKISQQTFFRVDPIGCKPGVLYGLSKVHKTLVSGLPKMRPILSAIGTAGYGLSKFLVPILSTVAHGPYTIVNNFTFNQEIVQQDPNLVMASLDVDALFTSIPLDETIGICANELYKDTHLVEKLTKSDMTKLLNLACKDTLFLFNGVYYNQIDGVTMGSPLGPPFANSFMNFHECKWLYDCPLDIKPKFYRRYVDDVFVLFDNVEQAYEFQKYLNLKHPNINFIALNRLKKSPRTSTQ